MSILTSPTQYLQPEYLSPTASSQLDTKNSPLALLVVTCNNIGKDNPNSKPLIPTLEKEKRRTESEQDGGRLSSASGTSGTITPTLDMELEVKSNGDSPKRDVNGISNERLKSPLYIRDITSSKSSEKDDYRASSISPKGGKKSETDGSGLTNSLGKCSTSNSISKSVVSSVASSAASSLQSAHGKGEVGQPLPGLAQYAAHMSSLPSLQSYSGYPYSLIGASGAAALLAAHKHNPESVKYTPVRTASGATTLIPLCSDPYCVHCKLSLHSAQLSPTQCSAGCVQCTHDKGVGLPPHYLNASSLSTGLLGLSGLASLHGVGSNSLLASAASAGINSAHPHICSWMAGTGSGVCGKRFSSSEELMQHLRSHTSSLNTTPSLHSGLSPYPSISSAQAMGQNAHLLHAASSALNPSLLRQAYSGRLSPGLLSPSRFHPYLKSLSSLGGSLPSDGALPPLHHSLGAYSSLYSLYGHKLGVP